jgi:hypothetical protein
MKSELSTIVDDTKAAYAQFAKESITAFEKFFRANLPAIMPPFRLHEITNGSALTTANRKRGEVPDRTGVLAGEGLYLIASDYRHQLQRPYKCRLEFDGLPVIYRGQAKQVRRRLQGHLFNKQYRERFGDDALTRCLKLDDLDGNNGGINIDEEPFASARWIVVTLPLPGSELTREFAEWGFVNAWGRPVASNERKKNPHDISLVDAEANE